VLDGHQYGSTPFATNAEALRNAEQHQQDRCPDANALISRQQPNQKRGDAHNQQRQDQHGLSPDPIAEMTTDDAANRARRETNRVRAERSQRTCQRVIIRKEQLAKDQRAGRAVKKEVVPFDGCADQTGKRHSADGCVAGICVFQLGLFSGFLDDAPRGRRRG